MKISVVVPVYNVEKYLKRCIESILLQTYKDYEIILVNDGSTDKSGEICNNYVEKYSNIRVINKSNKGLSDTRNVGIRYSRGEYIFFLDSDDYIVPNCLEVLYRNMVNNNAELSCGSFGFFDDNVELLLLQEENSYVRVDSGINACIMLLYGKRYYTSSCNILIKKDIAEKNLFPVGKYHEDEMTTFRYFLDASKVVITSLITYYYYQREGSIMHTFGQPVIDEMLVADYYLSYCKNKGKNILSAAKCRKYCLYKDIIDNYPVIKEKKPEMYRKINSFLKGYAINIILDIKAPFNIKKRAIKYLCIEKGK